MDGRKPNSFFYVLLIFFFFLARRRTNNIASKKKKNRDQLVLGKMLALRGLICRALPRALARPAALPRLGARDLVGRRALPLCSARKPGGDAGAAADTAAAAAADIAQAAVATVANAEIEFGADGGRAAEAAAPGAASSPGDGEPDRRKLFLQFTCGPCDTTVQKMVTRHSYERGVVIVRCDGCENLHLIADHLGWFEDESRTIEDIVASKGGSVARGSIDESTARRLVEQRTVKNAGRGKDKTGFSKN
jgi:hypothetical protein